MSQSKVVACVIARMESVRLPRKVLADVAGQPMLKRLVDRLKTCSRIDSVVVCTADTPANRELVTCAEGWGVPAFVGSELDVLGRILGGAEMLDAEHLIRVTGDNVCTDPTYLDALIEQHVKHDASYSRAANLPLGMTGEVMRYDMAKALHAELTDPEQTEYMILYTFNPDRHPCVVIEAAPKHRRPNYTLSIDVPAELAMADALFRAFPEKPLGPNIDEIVDWLDAHPEQCVELGDEAVIRMPHGKSISYAEFRKMFDERGDKSLRLDFESL
jgi:spore coat polysaccharide biosynthesis protein SpsF